MEVYFDNSATTRCYDSVKDIVVKTMTEDFGNPSAMHLKGVDAEKYVKESAKTIAGILKVQEKEILFTSGGTESDNLALIGGALANKRNGNHIIITSVEHAAVSQPDSSRRRRLTAFGKLENRMSTRFRAFSNIHREGGLQGHSSPTGR